MTKRARGKRRHCLRLGTSLCFAFHCAAMRCHAVPCDAMLCARNLDTSLCFTLRCDAFLCDALKKAIKKRSTKTLRFRSNQNYFYSSIAISRYGSNSSCIRRPTGVLSGTIVSCPHVRQIRTLGPRLRHAVYTMPGTMKHTHNSNSTAPLPRRR